MLKIYNNNVEEDLLLTLQDLSMSAPATRCLYLRLSRLEHNADDALVMGITSALEKIELLGVSKVFICADKDIFVINQSLSYDALEKFYTHLTPDLLPAIFEKRAWLASLFEIGMDWETLKNISIKKLHAARERDAPTRRYAQAGGTLDMAISAIDRDAIASLRERRGARRKIEVVIAEDDSFSRMLVDTLLHDTYSMELVGDGLAAVLSYVKKAPDVIFLDIGMPDMDGHEVLERIFTLDPEAYVVMFSGHGDIYNVTKAMSLGAKGFLSKPFSKEKFIRFIEKSPHVMAKNGVINNKWRTQSAMK